MKKIFLFILSLTLFTSCLDEDLADDYESVNETEILNYLEENNLTAIKNEEFGYYYIIDEEGDGINPVDNNVVEASYTFSEIDGEILDENQDGNHFILENVIFGLRLGLTHFSKGSSGKIIIPSRLGRYDGKVLIFDVHEVLNVFGDVASSEATQIINYLSENNLSDQTIETESGLFYLIEEEGNGENPTSVSNVSVIYKGYFLNGQVFDQTTAAISFNLQNVIAGWTEGITYFKEGGSGKLFIPSHLAYGPNGNSAIPPNTILIFDVNLVSIN